MPESTGGDYPDIEIYLHEVDETALFNWLTQHFEIVSHSHGKLTLRHANNETQCLIMGDAVSGGFTSVWFKHNVTPWRTDLDCARSAFAGLGVEVRCSSGPWQDDDGKETWVRLDAGGETTIRWP